MVCWGGLLSYPDLNTHYTCLKATHNLRIIQLDRRIYILYVKWKKMETLATVAFQVIITSALKFNFKDPAPIFDSHTQLSRQGESPTVTCVFPHTLLHIKGYIQQKYSLFTYRTRPSNLAVVMPRLGSSTHSSTESSPKRSIDRARSILRTLLLLYILPLILDSSARN